MDTPTKEKIKEILEAFRDFALVYKGWPIELEAGYDSLVEEIKDIMGTV